MEYAKTQHGRWHYILIAAAIAMLIGAWATRDERMPVIVLIGTATLMVVISMMFASMTVQDEGDRLAIRYGPVPLFRKAIAYADITSVSPDRVSLIDGWGIHGMPGRGWTYNLWGFGCVKLMLGRKVIRVGSDEPENLAAFLRSKVGVDE